MREMDLPALTGNWVWVAAIVVGVLGGARLTRLIVHDSYPPAVAVRRWWLNVTWNKRDNVEGSWGLLSTCHWCAGPYVFALVLFTAWITGLHWGWWLFWGWLAGSYLLAMVVERDEKD
jgi:hypothetical protein